MTAHEVSRTLVKSPPELWSECSDPASLARHLGESFGEIRITKLEPETAVAWEGERASGTVRLEPSGWGTKVVLTARAVQAEAAVAEPAPEAVVEPEPEAVVEPEPEPEAVVEPAPEPEAVVVPEPDPEAVAEPTLVADPAPPKRGFFQRIRALFGPEPAPEKPIALTPVAEKEDPPAIPEPVESDPPAMPEPAASDPPERGEITVADTRDNAAPHVAAPEAAAPDAGAALSAALDSLGQAHHRPFSRS
jgi:hypothetical protein